MTGLLDFMMRGGRGQSSMAAGLTPWNRQPAGVTPVGYTPGSRDEFIAAMMPHAMRVSAQTGLDPRLVIAQAAQETGWGKHAPGNNYFGIKSHGKPGGNVMATKEVIGGKTVGISDSFRGYGSMGDSADGYASFLTENPRYKPMLAAGDLAGQLAALGKSGYATDPNYAQSVGSIARSIRADGTADPGRGRGLLASARPPAADPAVDAPRGLLARISSSGAPEPRQGGSSFWDRVPGLSDPDRRARLAIGLEGMTLNPNQGLIDSFNADIEGRRDAARVNKTAEWLRGQPGGAQYADALESGAVDASTAYALFLKDQRPPDAGEGFTLGRGQVRYDAQGNVIASGPAEDVPEADPGFVMLSQEEAASMGLPPGAYQRDLSDGKVFRIGGEGTTINNNIGGDKFDEAFAKLDAESLATVSDAGLSAQRNISRIDRLDELLSQSPGGFVSGLALTAGEWGVPTDGLDTLQAAQAVINSLVPEQRPPGSGTMSDADLALFKASLPRIMNQPGGNKMIIDTMRGIAQYDAEGAFIVQKYRSGEITRSDAFNALQTRVNPLDAFKAPNGAPPPVPGFDPADAGRVLRYNPETGELE